MIVPCTYCGQEIKRKQNRLVNTCFECRQEKKRKRSLTYALIHRNYQKSYKEKIKKTIEFYYGIIETLNNRLKELDES